MSDILDMSMQEVLILLQAAERRVKQQNDEAKKSSKSNTHFGKKPIDSKDGDSIMKFFGEINDKVISDM